ncbi:DUF397 domain-containing protein [Streptomyces olivaceus]|uniref:DUF397 domain-containing protein n=1 Tax=Streptomyces olivaceus TaxID=47716 RepID=UPI0036E7879C
MTAQTKRLKSSYSGCEGNECVEVARRGSRVSVRDSKAPRETLAFSARVRSGRSPRSAGTLTTSASPVEPGPQTHPLGFGGRSKSVARLGPGSDGGIGHDRPLPVRRVASRAQQVARQTYLPLP